MIYTYGLSLTGLSHKKVGTVCQDAHIIMTLTNGWTVAAVADGVGSSKYADCASRLAVEIVSEFIKENAPSQWNIGNLKALIQVAFYRANEVIAETVRKNNHKPDDYDTTLTALIYNGMRIVYGHSGDGGIIGLTRSGDYVSVTKVQKGDEHNVVIPLSAGASKWIFDDSEEEFCSLLLLTDGLLDIMQPSLLNGEIYIRLTQQFMDNRIMQINETNIDDVRNSICEFFESEACQSISDDKTIIGIVNADIIPAVKDSEYYNEPDWERLRDERNKKLYPYLFSTTKTD